LAARGDDKIVGEQWERVKELFEAALDCSPPERAEFLSRLYGEAPAFAEHVSALLTSHEQAGDFLRQPLSFAANFLDDLEDPQRFAPDEVLCNRFKIVRLIGKGGMGEVYEAFDQELEERVALKTLRFEVSSNEIFTARFRREIQLARKVTHPNVCRIYESLRHQVGSEAISVLSMELLQGQTLGEYLKSKGRLTADEALPLARQIVDGLCAVHAAGIIHRDLKPSNLMLVPNGSQFQIKLTDFGIAGRLPENPAEPTLTQASKMLGTPDYMAPEQLEQGRATIQSDIYALGLVLYEMVTGTKPFAKTGAWKRLFEDPCPPHKLASDLSGEWNKTILCCLERTPEYRFSNAQAVAQSLIEDAPRALIPIKPLPVRLKATARKGVWFILTFLLVSAALAIMGLRYFRQSPQVPPGTTVLVTDIATEDPTLSGITVALKGELAQSAHFEIEEDGKIVEVLKQMHRRPGDALDASTAREVAWRSGIPLVVSGSLTSSGHGYLLSMTVEKIKYSPLFPALKWKNVFSAANKNDLLDSLHEAATWVRSLAGEALNDPKLDLPVKDTTTASWQALQFYSDSEKRYAQGDATAALRLLDQALEADPSFAKAHMRLADILISRKQYGKGYEEWSKAAALVKARTLTDRESLRIRGQFLEDTGDYEGAQDIYGKYETLYPQDYLPSFYRGSVLDSMGRSEEGLREMKEAERKAPDAYPPVAAEARLDLVLDKLHDAEQAIRRLRQMQHSDAADSIEVGLDMLREDFASAIKALDRLQSTSHPDYVSASYSLRAAFLRELGDDKAAIKALMDGASFDRSTGHSFSESDKWIALAYIYWKIGDAAHCHDAALQALTLENGPLHVLQAGTLLARTGFLSDAHKALSMLPSNTGFKTVDRASHQLEGEIFLAQHKTAEAVREMREAAAADCASCPKEYLARTLEASGDKAGVLHYYREIVEAPARIWQALDYQYPGFWSDVTANYSGLQPNTKDPALANAQARKAGLTLRP